MFCPNCGKKLPDDANFCGVCGYRITNAGDHSFAESEKSNRQQHPYGQKPYGQYSNGQRPNRQQPNGQNSYKQQTNVLAILGFVFSFFGIVGLILSILGYNKAKKLSGKGKGLAIAGIIISIVAIAAHMTRRAV